MVQILDLYLYFEGAKNFNVLKVLIWGFGRCWRFLMGVWHLDLDLYMVTVPWCINVPNFGSLSCLDFEGAKNLHVLKVLIWGFGGCWRFLTGFGIFILIWIWSMGLDIPLIQIWALYLDF